jgi:hypothetical protein
MASPAHIQINCNARLGRRRWAPEVNPIAQMLGINPNASGAAFDAFVNAPARLGAGMPNLAEGADYILQRLTFDYWLLITLYENHWIVRRIVDTPAKDMIRAWPKVNTDADPKDLDRISKLIRKTCTADRITQTIQWARLFGGAGALIVIDGHENQLDEPLNLKDIEIGAYKGLIPFERWTGIHPSLEICTDITRPTDFNLPEFYEVTARDKSFKVHASRILRFTGPQVPTPEREAYSMWGISVMAPVYEELRKRDNLSANLVSLTFRAQILGMVMPELAQMLSGASMTGAAAQQFHGRMEAFNQLLSNQSLALLPKDGSLQSTNWSASGFAELYAQFQMDIAGAAEIPVTRLFGRTLSGLGQSNDADERIYEERIAMEQEHGLRPQLDKLYPIMWQSELGEVPDDLELDFPSVRVLTEEEKGKLTVDTVASVTSLLNVGLFNKVQALKEIQQQSAITGFGTAIHDEDIAAAEKEDAAGFGGMGEMAGGAESESKPGEMKAGSGELGAEPSGEELLSKLAKASDSRPAPVIVKGAKARVVRRYDFAGLPIAVEFPAAVRRVIKNRDGKVVYDCVLPNDYGYIESTFGLDGDEIDVIVGPDEKSDAAYCVDMIDLGPDVAQRQNEQKILIGFPDREFATEAFLGMYPESFMGRMIEMPVQALIEKLAFHKALTNNERALALDEFVESKHPRVKGGENAGQFGKGSGGSSKAEAHKQALSAAPADPKQWPEHIKALKLPPAWTDVRINQNPDADLMAVGKDAKGRSQYVYSERFQNTQAEAKFTRIKDLDTQFAGMQKENTGRLRSDDAKVRDNAGCTRLIMAIGIRPGSETDTKAKVKAYGATTLEGRHVVVEDGQVYLRFTGKKGVALNLPVNDPAVAKDLQDRARQAGAGGKLYPHASGGSLLEYTHTLDGGGFKTKDFRTLLGTRTAMNQITKVPAPKNEKEYKKRVMEVAKTVSARLGNTPVVALTSYISPSVFSGWRISANV